MMQPIYSRTSTERIIRTVLIAGLINGFAVLYLKDGYIGYATQNAVILVKTLGGDPHLLPRINQELTANKGKRIEQTVGMADQLDTVTSQFGAPSLRHEDDLYYLGPGGHLRLRLEKGRVVSSEWRDGIHSEADILWQVWIGYTLGGLGLVFIGQLARVLTMRVSLTDTGLKVRRKPLIPFDAITRLHGDQYEKNGVLDIDFKVDGEEASVRLDSYVVKELPAIVSRICERCGLANPLKAPDEASVGQDSAAGDSRPND